MIRRLAVILALLAGGAQADAPLTAPRPMTRPAPVAPIAPPVRPDDLLAAAAPAVPRPLARPAPVLTTIAVSTRSAPQSLPGWGRIEPMLTPAATPAIFVVQAAPPLMPLMRPEQGDGGVIVPAALVLPPLSRPVVEPIRGIVIPAALIVPPPARPGLTIAAEIAQETRVGFVSVPVSLSPMAIRRAVLPELRPQEISLRAAERPRLAAPAPDGGAQVAGALCGNPAIRGEALGHVAGPGSCGVEDAVSVRSVHGIRLSEPATVTCATARALADWVRDGALDALPSIEVIETMGTYSCRGRNGQAGARLSEHAFGRALDIGGFRLSDGSHVTVLNNWGGNSYGRALRAMHRAACGTFGTVLGPEANAYHRNHFHFDTATYRSGSYCE